MASLPYSDLEVASSTDPEVAGSTDQDTHKYAHYSVAPTDADKIAYGSITHAHDKSAPQTICGLRKKTFWIVVVAAIVVVGSAAGGGVGGSIATRKSGETSSTSSTQIPATSMQLSSKTPPPTSSTQIVSTTTILGPTSSPQPTLLRDCPSSNNTLRTVTYGSASYHFRKLCNASYLNIGGVAAPVQGIVKSLDECIDICAQYNQNNRTDIQAGRDPLCNAVCWRNTFDVSNDWEGGHCFGFTTRNVTIDGQSGFNVHSEEICDSAALINQEI